MNAVSALNAMLAGEHAAVYIYSVLGAQTSESEQRALSTLLENAYAGHRKARDTLIDRIVALGGTPVASEAVYALPNAASTPQAAVIIDGTNWRCGADNVCVGTGPGANQPASRACRRVVAKVGAPLASFTYKGVTLTDEQLATCNTAAAA